MSQKNFSTENMEDGLKRDMKTWLTDPNCALDDDIYTRMLPAFWLASRFIYSSREFFDTIWYGDEVIEDGVIYLDHTSKPNTSVYDDFLNDVINRISNFQIYLGHKDDWDRAYAVHSAAHVTLRSGNPMRTWTIQVNGRFLDFFTHPSYSILPKATIERTQFILAVTLVHELVHACHSMKFQEHQPEPFYYRTDPAAELGRAWERWAFAGFPYESQDWELASSTTEIHVYNVEDDWCNPTSPDRKRATVLTALEIADFFDSDCWSILRDLTLKKTNQVYDGILKNNFIDDMKVARQIKDWQEKHGKWWPNPKVIQPIQRQEGILPAAPTSTTHMVSRDRNEDASEAGPSNTTGEKGTKDTSGDKSVPQSKKLSHVDELAAAFGVSTPTKK
ncbi:hypothetical protein LTR84_009598 [Exophiala bonariae]|uniref:SprT-like domain-containing protein n=1 Tax=Exophiala bonariae TaxID=1690606 RepID=A0AAV9NME3_9EURO|nr:hypothetical protein LTR84_009598 [Exophiala bonariae]